MISIFIGIGIFMLLYFSPKIFGGIKTISKKSQTPLKKGVPTVEVKSEPAVKSETPKTVKSKGNWLANIVGVSITVLIGLVIIVWLVTVLLRGCNSFERAHTEAHQILSGSTSTSSTNNYNYVYVSLDPNSEFTYIDVILNTEYGNIFVFKDDWGVSFLKATVDYCSINENYVEKCGITGQDISDQFGSNNAGLEFRFKSSGKEKGRLTLKIRVLPK